ncbi:hypothetical protein [Persicobacter sp. CCB-QB2]|uniref:hypothetical protein n=1 Tax=Persicobacter sp. CCB-QB2 TaxID=1561025 RepID=UPI0006A983B0|nr:hypothetical protein [Persicobacter sp. CCB-QB2]
MKYISLNTQFDNTENCGFAGLHPALIEKREEGYFLKIDKALFKGDFAAKETAEGSWLESVFQDWKGDEIVHRFRVVIKGRDYYFYWEDRHLPT